MLENAWWTITWFVRYLYRLFQVLLLHVTYFFILKSSSRFSGNFVFKIEVSKGEGVKPLSITIESILLANGETGLGITVPGHHGNTTSSQLFHNLETLVSYYRFVYDSVVCS